MTAVYRTGRHNRHLIYEQLGPEPSDDDPTVAYVDSAYAELAPLLVELLNAHVHWLTCGCTPPAACTCSWVDTTRTQHGYTSSALGRTDPACPIHGEEPPRG